jgi:hypothetical protein
VRGSGGEGNASSSRSKRRADFVRQNLLTTGG